MTDPAPGPKLAGSPLQDRHVALGARMGEFGGWQMPISYAGVLEEHAAVRERVGVFDVSHLGKGVVRGAGAMAFVNDRLTADLRKIGPGQAQYTMCCDDATGGVVDDLIAYLRSPDEVFLVPNAANSSTVVGRLAADAVPELEVEDLHTRLAVLAVQGPRSAELLDALGLPTSHPYLSFVAASWHGREVVVCRSGYTGEHGYELFSSAPEAGDLWDAVLAAGGSLGVVACGLAARDTLRTEMGYPLHGQDLSPEITPVQAGAGWAVGWDKPRFWGREALLAEKERGPTRRLWGLESLDRGIPRPRMPVTLDGRPVGVVTSGTFSPTRRIGIGLALLATDVGASAEVEIDVRGRPSRLRVLRPPFVPSRVRD